MFLECTIYEYIKLSYVISDAGHDTLYIFVLDITMCISKCSSATHDGPLANGGPGTNEPWHLSVDPAKPFYAYKFYMTNLLVWT